MFDSTPVGRVQRPPPIRRIRLCTWRHNGAPGITNNNADYDPRANLHRYAFAHTLANPFAHAHA